MNHPPDPSHDAAHDAPAGREPLPGWAMIQFDWSTREPAPQRRSVVLRSVAQAAGRTLRRVRAAIWWAAGTMCPRSVPNER